MKQRTRMLGLLLLCHALNAACMRSSTAARDIAGGGRKGEHANAAQAATAQSFNSVAFTAAPHSVTATLELHMHLRCPSFAPCSALSCCTHPPPACCMRVAATLTRNASCCSRCITQPHPTPLHHTPPPYVCRHSPPPPSAAASRCNTATRVTRPTARFNPCMRVPRLPLLHPSSPLPHARLSISPLYSTPSASSCKNLRLQHPPPPLALASPQMPQLQEK